MVIGRPLAVDSKDLDRSAGRIGMDLDCHGRHRQGYWPLALARASTVVKGIGRWDRPLVSAVGIGRYLDRHVGHQYRSSVPYDLVHVV